MMRSGFLILLIALGACRSEGDINTPISLNPNFTPPTVPVGQQLDRVVQTRTPAVDILFVVDNSCSMLEEQEELGENFPLFMDYFLGSGLDYHIGVISTDMNDPAQTGRLLTEAGSRWIEPTTAQPEATFQNLVTLGNEGHHYEQGRAAVFTAIELLGDTENAGFVREDAELHVTIVSDEDDESGPSPIARDEFIDWMQELKFTSSMTTFSSIVGPPGGCPEASEPGTDYHAITAGVGGINWPICSENWAGVLDLLGLQAAGLTKEFFLTQRPQPESIEVIVIQQAASIPFGSDQWVYSPVRNSITFTTFIPDELAVVELRYDLLAITPEREL